MLLALAAIWGSSFMFIEIALRDLAPSTLILLRMSSGAAALAIYIKATGRSFRALLPYAWPLALLGLVNTAVPFFLIAWGQQYIDSGLAAIFNASAPLFTALFAVAYDQSQRVTGMRLAGVVLGFGGVVLLVGFELSGGEQAVAGGLAVVGASACYGLGGLYAGRRFPGLETPLVALRARSSGRHSSCFRSESQPQARPAGRRSPPCSTSASRLPVSRISSTSG